MGRTVSAQGRLKIMGREGVRLETYPDPATGGEPYTIGVGHTGTIDGVRVRMGMQITMIKAKSVLTSDLARFEAAVNAVPNSGILSGNQFDACVSIALNIGDNAFTHSTIARRIAVGDLIGAGNAFLMWNKAGGHVMDGLDERRKAELAQFRTLDGEAVIAPSRVASKGTPSRTISLPEPIINTPAAGGFVAWLRRLFNRETPVAQASAANPSSLKA